MKTVGVFGSQGRMGQEIMRILAEDPATWQAVGVDKETTAPWPKADLWIDFSTPEGLRHLLAKTKGSRTAVVSGTTGLTDADFQVLRDESHSRAVLWSANMSIGVAWLKSILPQLAKLKGFDVQVLDFHHNRKLDSPSGTAKSLQETLTKNGVAPAGEPLAFRLGGIYGVHKVFAVSDSEWITLEHTALNRTVFAQGAVLAGNWLLHQSPGMYSVESMLESV